ncbi:protein THEMIS2 [Polypterus senegalus]|nr:protein THEMIS2 [Polypterus senegalus]XP_039595772.1 protein THEMIS2 [Polypterus senegalus]
MAGTSSTAVLSLQEYITSIDIGSLPRIVQICSGVYFQGSVYEVSGNEVCLSTGDLVKIISAEIIKASCEDVNTNDTFELPLDFKGSFKLIPNLYPYSTVEEMVSMIGELEMPFYFTSKVDIHFQGLVIRSGEVMELLSAQMDEGKKCAHCILRDEQGEVPLYIPFSCHGEFYQVVSTEAYTLQEILKSPRLCSCRMNMVTGEKGICSSQASLLISPVYEIHAIMQFRKNSVKIPSNLEVDLIDVTEQCQDVTFITPLNLKEVFSQPDDSFPAVCEILETSEHQNYFKSAWLPKLKKGHSFIIHEKLHCQMILTTTVSGKKPKRYFLIWDSYGGCFRMRPREFTTVHDLSVAASRSQKLQVNVSKYCESIEEDLPSLSIGDQLEVLYQTEMQLNYDGALQLVDVLVCNRITDVVDDDDDELPEQISLPMYLEGGFVEKLSNNKKYTILDISKKVILPVDVKVAVRDPSVEDDILGNFLTLRLEEIATEPVLIASLMEMPDYCFKIPINWIDMSVFFSKEPLPQQAQELPLRHESVSEVMDNFYFDFRKITISDLPPPPRPPKRQKSSKKNSSPPALSCPPMDDIPPRVCRLSISEEKPMQRCTSPLGRSPLESPPEILPRKSLAQPDKSKLNEYVKSPKKTKNNRQGNSDDDDHDYESIDDTIRSMQESVSFY